MKRAKSIEQVYEELIQLAKDTGIYQPGDLRFDIAHEIVKRMQQQGVYKESLAAAIPISRTKMTKLLKGQLIITLDLLDRIAFILDCKWEVRLRSHDRRGTNNKIL